MPRSQGFARGDIDTAFPLDDKFLALRGRLTSERYYAAAGVYFHVVAATWREAERKTAVLVAPDAADLIADLVAVGLLDGDGRVTTRAFTSWIGRARRSRKVSAERQARNRAQMSRAVTPLSRVTNALSSPRARSVGTVGKEGTDTGGAGGAEPHIEAWLMVKHRLPTVRQQEFLDRYLQVFDVTGPERMAALILRNPSDPIASLKADLDSHREERAAALDNGHAEPRKPPKREPWQDMFRAVLEAKEAETITAKPLPVDS